MWLARPDIGISVEELTAAIHSIDVPRVSPADFFEGHAKERLFFIKMAAGGV